MVKIDCPKAKEETARFYENVKALNSNLDSSLHNAETEIDCALDEATRGIASFAQASLRRADLFLVESKEWDLEQVDPEEFKTYPLKLRRAIADNYFDQGVTRTKLERRLIAVKTLIAAATKQ